MSITLHLKPEVEAGLVAQAQASGMDLEGYLLALAEEAALLTAGRMSVAQRKERAEAVRRMLEFGDKHHLSLGEPITLMALHESHQA